MRDPEKSIKKQKWKVLVEDWQASGLSARKWCEGQGISSSTFQRWKELFSSAKESERSSFLELLEESTSKIEMEFNGIKVYVENNFNESLLVRCLQALKRTSSC